MSLSTWSRRAKLLLLGALSFWLLDVLLHAAEGYDFFGLDVWLLTVAMPLLFFAAHFGAKRLYGRSVLVAPWMLLGVWLLGNSFMMIGASFSEGGLAIGPFKDTLWMLLLSLLPPSTFMMATYDGSLFALFLVTGLAVVLWIVEATHRAIKPTTPSHAQ